MLWRMQSGWWIYSLLLSQRRSEGLRVRPCGLTWRLGTSGESHCQSHACSTPPLPQNNFLLRPEWLHHWQAALTTRWWAGLPLGCQWLLLAWCHPSSRGNGLQLALEALYGAICNRDAGSTSSIGSGSRIWQSPLLPKSARISCPLAALPPPTYLHWQFQENLLVLRQQALPHNVGVCFAAVIKQLLLAEH